MRKLRIKNTKACAEGHTESELPTPRLCSSQVSRRWGAEGWDGWPFPPAACLQHFSALSTLSLPSGILVILKQNADSRDGTGKEGHQEASIIFPEFSPTASSTRSGERGPPGTCLSQRHLALP